MERVVAVGCTFRNSVGKKSDYLVLGDANYAMFVDGHQTGKLARAVELRSEGAEIEVIAEQQFLEMRFD